MWIGCHSFMTVSVTLTHRMAFSNMCKFFCLSLMTHFISQTVSLGEVTKSSLEREMDVLISHLVLSALQVVALPLLSLWPLPLMVKVLQKEYLVFPFIQIFFCVKRSIAKPFLSSIMCGREFTSTHNNTIPYLVNF